jgi:hypothetical protein
VGLVNNAPVSSVPEVAFDPLQLPEPVHEVAFVVDQVSVLPLPLPTDIGEAESETVGAAVEPPETVTVALSTYVRPLPLVHVSVYVADAFNAPVLWLPEVAFDPLHAPDAVHEAMRDVDHVSVLLPPAFTELGLAVSETVGIQLCACAGDAAPLPIAARSTASASGANRLDDFMGGDHSHNAPNTVCLQTATRCREYSYLVRACLGC